MVGIRKERAGKHPAQLLKDEFSGGVSKVPFLGDIPGLGAFFRNVQKSSQKAELLIFVTPKILSENLK